jgi:alkanesulfonate monooxygenase SsuD/methylene tetrahydromethanopterin reductase-like flavin-dependent oxidoreductase (luciferase family)
MLKRRRGPFKHMEFGLYIRPVREYGAMVELARRAEGLGLFGVFLNDHVEGLSGDRREPYLESWTALTGIGAETRRIRLGHVTLFNSLRNPALLAKMISTLDVMTGGRYETIVGAGWSEPEYRGYDLMGEGRGMPPAGERVTKLKETVQILKGMFDDEVFSFKGRYWRLEEAVNVPGPVQRPMRISVGARQGRMIRIAARYADGMNGSGNLRAIRGYVKTLVPELKVAGKRMGDFFLSGFTTFTLTRSEAETEAVLARVARGRSLEEVRDDFFVGTPEVLVGKLRECADLGIRMMIVIPMSSRVEEIESTAERLRDEVFSQL